MGLTSTPSGELEVRDARDEDRDAVVAFCAETFGDDGDYIGDVWDDWLADARGALLVGAVDGQPIAVSHVRMTAPDEAWIEGVRVAPEARRQGVARVIVSRSLARAHELGASVARMFTGNTNVASQRLFEGFGFRKVAELAYYVGAALSPDPEEAARQRPPRSAAELDPTIAETTYDTTEGALPVDARLATPGPAEFARLWAWLEQSNLTPFNGGLEIHHWSGRGLSELSLREYLAAGAVTTLDEWGATQALAIVSEDHSDGPELEVRYIDGLSDAIGRLALLLRSEAYRRTLAQVWLWLPDLLILRDAMDGAGYRRGDEAMWVYARAL
ncbi:MAG TPA: GNAT family N-acetyltransferase [Ktedonobacterales bacterium]|nr:GNAT family N-acetyltransferase [Ktedonobacterales bacterium]